MRRLVFVFLFFIMTPVVLATSLFSLVALAESPHEIEVLGVSEELSAVVSPRSGVSVYGSVVGEQPSLDGSVGVSDARPEIVRQYLVYYNSPLVGHAEEIVRAADYYGLDFRLITAIAQQESNLCKIIPYGTYNCWGWGIHSEGTLGFSSFSEGIWTVSEGIKTEYIDKGYNTIELIMSKYTPLSNGSWAHGVSFFMNQMR